jgi:uncharacterized protein (TIGR00375 family)
MRTIFDFHIHSKYSRACSQQLELPTIARACETKGIELIGTGDFTHPAWFKSIQQELVEDGEGVFKLAHHESPTRFVLSTELSLIYKEGDKVRRVHHLILAPSLKAVATLNKKLEELGCNLKADGRPILGLTSKKLMALLYDIDENFELVPAHAWTPWFAVFGSKSGYDSLEECFGDFTPRIHAIETGLSSDPAMNWRLSQLDSILFVSNSDAHSPNNLGREANVLDISRTSYRELLNVIRGPERHKFLYTIEFFPEEGKYHYDGHKDCGVMMPPSETKKNGGLCPKCKKPLTVGVMNRVDLLADRDEKYAGQARIPFKSIVPLAEIISNLHGVGVASKKVQATYEKVIRELGSEFFILLDAPIEDISNVGGIALGEGVLRVREGRIHVSPGYDGEYGTVEVFRANEIPGPMQKKLI